jgi:hypothetical protein
MQGGARLTSTACQMPDARVCMLMLVPLCLESSYCECNLAVASMAAGGWFAMLLQPAFMAVRHTSGCSCIANNKCSVVDVAARAWSWCCQASAVTGPTACL